jgi:hypothetical protein
VRELGHVALLGSTARWCRRYWRIYGLETVGQEDLR